MKDICKMPKKAIFEILWLHYLKFQIPTAYGLNEKKFPVTFCNSFRLTWSKDINKVLISFLEEHEGFEGFLFLLEAQSGRFGLCLRL